MYFNPILPPYDEVVQPMSERVAFIKSLPGVCVVLVGVSGKTSETALSGLVTMITIPGPLFARGTDVSDGAHAGLSWMVTSMPTPILETSWCRKAARGARRAAATGHGGHGAVWAATLRGGMDDGNDGMKAYFNLVIHQTGQNKAEHLHRRKMLYFWIVLALEGSWDWNLTRSCLVVPGVNPSTGAK